MRRQAGGGTQSEGQCDQQHAQQPAAAHVVCCFQTSWGPAGHKQQSTPVTQVVMCHVLQRDSQPCFNMTTQQPTVIMQLLHTT
jgi:hypothetical protein